MRDKQAAFRDAAAALAELGVPTGLPALRTAGVSVQRRVLGGSHSVVTYPPLHALRPIDPTAVGKIRYGTRAGLYVHIAFCETHCTFCHYAVEQYSGKDRGGPSKHGAVARYLAALKRELSLWGAKLRESGTSISSVYIGGGTPLVLEKNELGDLIRAIRNEFSVLPGAEFCVEGSPLTITADDGEDKLRFLKERGVTRLSFGVQSFDDEVLRLAARGYRREVATRACEIAARVFQNWNTDLIQGLCKGSPDEVWENIGVVERVLPPHLTWYHGRFANRPQGKWLEIASRRANFETEGATLLGRMLIWQEMVRLGYRQIDGNRFVREDRYTDPFKLVRTSVDNDLLGIGASAYSHVDGNAEVDLFFQNTPNIGEYVRCVEEGGTAVSHGRPINREERFAASYVIGLRTGRIENEDNATVRRANPGLARHYDDLVAQLTGLGVLERFGEDGLRLSRLGQLFEDETLSLFYSPAVQQALA